MDTDPRGALRSGLAAAGSHTWSRPPSDIPSPAISPPKLLVASGPERPSVVVLEERLP